MSRYIDMDPLDVLRHEGELLATAADDGFDRSVPPCPGWTVRDVVAHVSGVHRGRAEQVRGRHQERIDLPVTPPEGDGALLAWYREGLADLVQVLAATADDEPVWSWQRTNRTAGFWKRRMAHETTVHRVDVQSAFGDVTHVDDSVAIDGIDEVLDAILVAFSRRDVGGDGRTVAFRTGDRVWRVTPQPDRVDLDRSPGPAPGPVQATVSAEPSELYLWLWGRRPDESVHVEGDWSAAVWPRRRIARITGPRDAR
ncbi:MAG: maleylpyruvate isomerase family mycothiol-dependent enzyme [Streptosporangiales bacterium]|nr:maleylpyruvate isomerase family mycothiol-dependent enzyme [Streptosporangiales bacterium]